MNIKRTPLLNTKNKCKTHGYLFAYLNTMRKKPVQKIQINTTPANSQILR